MSNETEEQTAEELIKEFIEEHSIELIIETYLEEHCYGVIVETIMDHINRRLEKLSKIEALMR